MLNKIISKVETVGQNTVIRKTFQRGLQTIDTTSAYIGDKLYYRDWFVREHGKATKYAQTYNAGHPIKGSKLRLDINA